MRNLLPYLPVLMSVASASAHITLGTAETFAVLGGSTVTNTGATDIKGNLGVSPGTAVVGFPPGTMLVGAIHAGDAVAQQAQADAATAYNALAALPCTFNLTGQDLGGQTLIPGVYCFDSSAQLTGALNLNFNGGSGSFVFQIGSTLTTASNSVVKLANFGKCAGGCSINWQVGSSATLGTSSKFSGNILALASITITTDVYICGRALAQTGAVTMDTDKVYFMGTLNSQPAEISGSGQIPVPQTNSGDVNAGGNGRASFAFLTDPNGMGTYFDYRSDVTGARIYGLIDSVTIVAMDPDGSPKTVNLVGSCDSSLPRCSFSIMAQVGDQTIAGGQLGLTITGFVSEQRSLRAISAGQIEIY